MPWPLLKNGIARMWSITSFAQTPFAELAAQDEAHRLRHGHAHVRVNHALAMSVEPTPNAKQPSAPAMHVCESVPATS